MTERSGAEGCEGSVWERRGVKWRVGWSMTR